MFAIVRGRLLQGRARVISLAQFSNLPFRDRNTHVQQPEVERLGQVIVRPSFQRLLQVRRVRASRDQQNKHLVAIRLRAQLPAEIDPAFPGQHPVQNEKGERLPGEDSVPPPPRSRQPRLRGHAARSAAADSCDYRGDLR